MTAYRITSPRSRTSLARGIAAALALAVTGACSPAAQVDEDLRRDLDAAVGSTIEFAPQRTESAVVSSVELGTTPAPSTARTVAPAPRPAPRVAAPRPPAQRAAPVPEPQQVELSGSTMSMEPTPAPVEIPAGVPAPRPAVERAPRGEGAPPPGGWKTMEEVIRKAPFPINP
jgi:hypothetical protein